MKFFKGIAKFFKEVGEELRKVSWPTRQELTQATVLVVIASIALTTYIALVDMGLSKVIHIFLA